MEYTEKDWARMGLRSPASLAAEKQLGALRVERQVFGATQAPVDPVNHPPHYKHGGIETIDIIEAKGLGFHLGNAVKYILRAGHKDDARQDIEKARWYLDRWLGAQDKEQSK